jgi:hypothetical protein
MPAECGLNMATPGQGFGNFGAFAICRLSACAAEKPLFCGQNGFAPGNLDDRADTCERQETAKWLGERRSNALAPNSGDAGRAPLSLNGCSPRSGEDGEP